MLFWVYETIQWYNKARKQMKKVPKANVRGDSLVKAWREYKGLTQAELSVKAGIKQPALARMEKPDANLRKSTLIKLADAMGLTVEQLIE